MRYKQPLQIIFIVLLIVPLVAACRSNSQPDGQAGQPVASDTPTSTQAVPTLTAAIQPTDTPDINPTAGSTQPATATAAPSPTEIAKDLCDVEDLAEYSGAVPISNSRPADPSARLFDLWIALDGITALSWASYWIIHAQIAAECSGLGNPGGEPDYIVKVTQTFRGSVHEYLRVSGIHYGSPSSPTTGDEVMLFVSSPGTADNNGKNWVTGGPQGSWYIEDGLVGGEYSALQLTIEEFGQAVVKALEGNPPEHLPVPAVSLQGSPLNPDLTAADMPYPAGCDGVLFPKTFPARETVSLLWTSQQVVAGTVIEQLPSFQLEEPSHETDVLLRPVVTDYLVQVEDPIRGLPDEIVRVRQLGGEIGDCTVTNREGQLLEVGHRAMMFLWTPEPGGEDPTYYLNGGSGGFWRFDQNGTLLVREANRFRSTVILSAQAFADGLRIDLANAQFDYGEYGPEPVSLDAAPAGPPVDWPPFEREPTLNWISYQHPEYNLQFDHPEGWSILDSDDSGTMSLANYPTVGGDWESIPDGGVRIDITRLDSSEFFMTTPVTIGKEAYPGTIRVASGITGDTYHVYIVYVADGQEWVIAGFFKEPIELENPNTDLFLAVVMSITHSR